MLNKKKLPLQFGNPKWPSAHLSHLSPTILGLQEHLPVLISQSFLADPSGLQLHSVKFDDYGN